MAAIKVVSVSKDESIKILRTSEGQFADVKAIEISPRKLTKAMSAFANTEGGELYLGIAERNVILDKPRAGG